MSFSPEELDRVREALGRPEDGPAEGCPTDERIWAAAAGELPPDEVQALSEHAARCGWCALSWRAALELGAAGQETDAAGQAPVVDLTHERNRRTRTWPLAVFGAAAVLAACVTLVVVLPSNPPGDTTPPVYRDARGESMQSLAAEPLDRARPALAWSSGPAGSLYDVEVTTAQLAEIARARGLAEARYEIPPASLTDVAPGAKLYWTVTVWAEDGTALGSQTFVSTLP